MGYTHYWDTKGWSKKDVEGYKTARPIIQDILNRYSDIIQFDYEDPKPAVASAKLVRFNGIGDEGHETFYFPIKKNQNDYNGGNDTFNFTKTARKAYDIVVCEVLLVLKAHMPGITINSDGFSEGARVGVVPAFDGEWEQAIKNVAEYYGIHYKKEVTNRRPAHLDGYEYVDLNLVFDKFVSAVTAGMQEPAVA